MRLSEDKAYILGLFVGGGTISENSFQIIFPFKQWGENVSRMNVIAKDILSRIQPKFRNSYGFPINYENPKKQWIIVPNEVVDLRELKNDLKILGLPSEDFLLNRCDLSTAKKNLKGVFAELFLSGIFDSRASLTASHRRFTKSAPIVSIEIPGSTWNFKFVVQFCEWLTDLGSVTDQILFNHPCQHSAINPNYKGWKKGFKIRLLIKSFLAKHSFAMQSKAKGAIDLKITQGSKEQLPCIQRTPEAGFISIHSDIKYRDLPEEVRGQLFLHYHHICAVLGCKHAPINAVRSMVKGGALTHISPFPVLIKEVDSLKTEAVYDKIIQNSFKEQPCEKVELTTEKLLLIFPSSAYPEIESAVAFLFSSRLRGNRHCGPKDDIISSCLQNKIKIKKVAGGDFSPILLVNPANKRAAILSSNNGEVLAKTLKGKISVNDIRIKAL
jgi:hypothetical protein